MKRASDMRKEYDIRGGERGKFYGKVKGYRIITESPDSGGELTEAVRLLARVRPHLKDTQRAEKLREQIEKFLGRVEL
jgi:hypothetical protein